MIANDTRANMMLDWLRRDLSLDIGDCSPASSDASFRRYFRIDTAQGLFIVMDAPPDKENIEPFIKVANLLAKYGINVPTIFHENRNRGFLVLEDFGSSCFLDQLTDANCRALYQTALDSLFKQQTQISVHHCDLPLYHEDLLSQELALFDDWYLSRSLNLAMPGPVQDSFYKLLIKSAQEQPVTCVHRDYHSRNLMVIEPGCPGVIDFQDAVIGPITYDLVSLLKDCYISWPLRQVEQWMTDYYHRLWQAGQVDCSLDTFKRWFDLMGLQRHLKAIGIFSRLHLRDHKPGYLKDIPRTLNYVIQTCGRYPETAEFADFLVRQVLPAQAGVV
ncbi:MAG: aminoglycoside phosphotransferase [Gammaproteobacteria bacterium HGW-Gammaproteobacteria-3]|nr:MAG: aminoglycoside phosphotransferase [Gammaproteobacteria bacterium HGW-Gammaproteobacteria-3]